MFLRRYHFFEHQNWHILACEIESLINENFEKFDYLGVRLTTGPIQKYQ